MTTISTPSRAHLRRATPTAGTGYVSWREQPGEEQSGLVTGDKRQGSPGSRRCGAAAFAAPFGRKPYGATICRARLPRHRPQPGPAVTPRCRATRAGPGRHARAECADRRAKGHSRRAGTPRIVQVGPSSVKGTPRSFVTASQKGSSGPTLERRSLCRPSGPDGEGQARGQARYARGAPLRLAPIGRTRRSKVCPSTCMRKVCHQGLTAISVDRLGDPG